MTSLFLPFFLIRTCWVQLYSYKDQEFQYFQWDHRSEAWKWEERESPNVDLWVNKFMFHTSLRKWFWQHCTALLVNTECFLSSLRQIKISAGSFLFLVWSVPRPRDFKACDDPAVTTFRMQTSANRYHRMVSEIMLHLSPLRVEIHTACNP